VGKRCCCACEDAIISQKKDAATGEQRKEGEGGTGIAKLDLERDSGPSRG